MKVSLIKDVEWKNGKSVATYYVKVDSKYVEIAYSEEEALEKYENVKANYVDLGRKIIKEEEI